jgi:hypothetical protein
MELVTDLVQSVRIVDVGNGQMWENVREGATVWRGLWIPVRHYTRQGLEGRRWVWRERQHRGKSLQRSEGKAKAWVT